MSSAAANAAPSASSAAGAAAAPAPPVGKSGKKICCACPGAEPRVWRRRAGASAPRTPACTARAARRLSVHRACTAPPPLAPPRRAAETRKPRDECVVMFGEEACAAQIDAHKACLRRDGFDVK
jgi:cytochrome c oxidase assembly protein subunit 17